MDKINKDWIIGILVVIVLVLIGLFFAGKKETLAPTTNETVSGSKQINTTPTAPKSGNTTQSTSKPVVQTTVAPAPTERTIVTYTDTGFEPTLVVIKKGQTVQFVNESSKNMWVASDPYPSNSNYPSFNQRASVGKGGVYNFTFTQTGTWTYHNDLNPSRRGSVIVNYE